jgi:hypothetical protein
MASSALRLGKLLHSSFTFVSTHIAAIAIGVAIFGIVNTAVKVATLKTIAPMVITTMTGQEMSMEKLQELQVRAEAGEEAAQMELMAMAEQFSGNMGENMLKHLPRIVLMVVALALVSTLLIFAANGYFINLALKPKTSMQMLLWQGVKFILPLFGITLWTFVRSYIWIPVVTFVLLLILLAVSAPEMATSVAGPLAIGMVLAVIVLSIIFYPRFALAPVIYLQDRKGVIASVQKSLKETTGYWAKIVGNLLVVGIGGAVLLGIAAGVVQGIAGPLSPVSMLVSDLLQFAFMGFQIVFLVKLAQTIREHPIS